MKADITEIRNDREINLLIEKGNEVLREQIGRAHV